MSKQEEVRNATQEAQEKGSDLLPAYSATPVHIATAESPLNFPSDWPPLVLTSATTSALASAPAQFQKPIAIPQITSDKAAPFLDAYARLLLQYGITRESWRAFLSTMSAFLAARVSEQALAHTVDIGHGASNVPKRFGQDTVGHAKSVGHSIPDDAKSGNYVGAAIGVVGATITLPVGTALRAVGAVLSLPVKAIGAITQKLQTPRERADAYATAVNRKWLAVRGL